MPPRRFDLIISDIDGCLAPEASLPMDLPSLARIAEHNHLAHSRADRPVLTLCSGRPQPFAEAMCRFLHNTSAPCVCENGVWTYHPGTNFYTMDPAITGSDLAAVREASRYVQREYGTTGVTEQPGKSASVSLYHPDTAYLRSIAPRLAEAFERQGWPLKVSMTWLYINCDLRHISKGTGIDRLLAHSPFTGTPRDRLAGIGDTTGDRAIRERVAFFACPANAQDEIKREADYVSPYPEAEGVVDILNRMEA